MPSNKHYGSVEEEGTIDHIPRPEEIAEEREPDPPVQRVPLPKGLIVEAMDGVTVTLIMGLPTRI
jgi:hypothetical protein